jgi:hypothetical protein
MAYAEGTKVPVAQSVADIQRVVAKYGGAQFAYGLSEDHAVIGFSKDERQVRFPLKERNDQQRRAAMRALLLVIKAKLEAVASGISIFEDEFLANIVLPNGRLVGQETRPRIAVAYETGEMPKLLPDFSA